MLKNLLIALAITSTTAFAAQAQDAAKLAEALPPEISEVATAGTWTEGEKTGVFRAIVITAPAGKTTQVYFVVQLMQVSDDGTDATITKTIPIKQVSDKKLPNAFLAIEEDTVDNEITWRLTSYNAETDTDAGVLVTVNAKGTADVKDAPQEEAAPEEPQGEAKKQ